MKLDRIWTALPLVFTILLTSTGISYAQAGRTAGGPNKTDCGYLPTQAHEEMGITEDFTSVQVTVVSSDPSVPLPASTTLLIEGPGQPVCLPVNESGNIEDSGLWDAGTYRFSVGDRNSTQGSQFKLLITKK